MITIKKEVLKKIKGDLRENIRVALRISRPSMRKYLINGDELTKEAALLEIRKYLNLTNKDILNYSK